MPRLSRSALPVLVLLSLVACQAAVDDGEPAPTGGGAGPGPSAREGDEITTKREDVFEETGVRVVRSKVVDHAKGELRDVTVDALTGQPVDYDALRGAEMHARRVKYGAFTPSFAARVAGRADASLTADVLAELGPSALEGEALKRELEHAGARVLRMDGTLASIEASPSVLQTLSRDTRIASIEARQEKIPTSITAAKDLGEIGLEWPHLFGIGSDLKIAVVEPNVCIRRTHQDFRWVTFDSPPSGCSLQNGAHSTAVAGVLAAIRMIDGQWMGAGLFRAHLIESDVNSGGLAPDPDFFNMSATHSPIEVRTLDEAVYLKRTTMFAGSANSDSGVSGATCSAYNLTCVGGYGMNGTPENFTDDVHATSAMWQNPPNGREEPDLVGPMGVTTAGWNANDSYQSWGGTSFATPAVTGLAALLVAKYRTQLGRQPTLMRALLSASAIVHPVNDGDGTRIPIIGDSVDDRAGAGAPNGDKASYIVESGTFHAAKVTRGVDFDAAGKYSQVFSVNAAQGERVRAALTWDNCPVNPLSYPNQDALIVDLDLAVRGPNVPIVFQPSPPIFAVAAELSPATSRTIIIKLPTTPFFATNASHVDNYETVEFVAPVAGNYRFEITAPRWGLCPYDNGMSTNIALVWARQ
jgi:Subtilase family